MLCSMSAAGMKFASTSYICIYIYRHAYPYIYVYTYRMSGGSISSQFSQVESKSAKLGQPGWGTDVGLESGNCAVELASHIANTPPRPPTTPTYKYITYMYIERQDGSDVRNLLRARGIGASADRERRQSSCRRPGTHTYMSIQFQISQG